MLPCPLNSKVAITSDVAGSTRIPAYFNGIFGHKPTGGALPNTGTDPKPSGLIYRFCQFGPTTRHAKVIYACTH
eukprot:Pgem_evm1s12471